MGAKPVVTTFTSGIVNPSQLNSNLDILATAIADGLDRAGDSDTNNQMSGALDMGGKSIKNLATPSGTYDGVNKNYVDTTIQQLLDVDVTLVATDSILKVTNLAALRTITPIVGQVCFMKGRISEGDGGGGIFRWDASNLSSLVTVDTLSGIYVAPNSDTTGASGAWVRVLDGNITTAMFGSKGDGVTDSRAAFEAASIVAPSATINDYENTTKGIPMMETTIVVIPAGDYVLSGNVSSGSPINPGREIIWVCESGVRFVYPSENFLGGRVVHPGIRLNSQRHYGIRDSACGHSIISNRDLRSSAEVLGFPDPSYLSVYTDRDSVGEYVDNRSPELVGSLTGTTFTATSVTDTVGVNTSLMRVGMIIDTNEATKHSGMVTSWSADGKTINVSAWYLCDGSRATGTPVNGSTAYVNAFTKIWAHNANVVLVPNGGGKFYLANQATGFELGCFNNRAAPSAEGADPKVWGFDAVNLGTYKCESAFVARGGTAGFYKGYEVLATDIGFAFTGDGLGLRVIGDGNPIEAKNGLNVQKFLVTTSGALELGAVTNTDEMYIDMHSSGNNNDYDCRISSTGGTAANGTGSLNLNAATINQNAATINLNATTSIDADTVLRPSVDDSVGLGQAARRWSSIYATAIRPGDGTVLWTTGAGSPEGSVTAPIGSMFTRTDGGAGTTLYVKESGTGNTGWVAK